MSTTTNERTPSHILDALFPLPTTIDADVAPALHLGTSIASAKTLMELLKDDYDRHHIFFDEKGLHNHATHHLYAIYTLGATPDVLEAAYETHVVYQRPLLPSPSEVTESNWKKHLGDEKYYRAYLTFFSAQALKHGISKTLENFVFSPPANWDPEIKEDAKQPQMLNRFFSGLIHPMIHVGHACEFGTPGMLAEGIAMACITGTDFDVLIPRELFSSSHYKKQDEVSQDTSVMSELVSKLSLSPDSAPSSDVETKASSGADTLSPVTTPTQESKSKRRAWHTFTLLARMLSNPALAPGAACPIPPVLARFEASDGGFPLDSVLRNRGALIKKYANLWEVNGEDEEEVKEKIEELAWVVSLIYGVGGWSEGRDGKTGGEFVADFFTMHLVTSSLFLPSITAHLSPRSKSLLLRTYLGVALSVWVARGRPPLSLKPFYAKTSARLVVPGPKPTPSEGTLGFFDPSSGFARRSTGADGLATASEKLAPNTWLPVLQSTILHPNEHLPKLQRALAHYALRYGYETRAERWQGWTELEGSEVLDGTLFARIAGLTMRRLGWMREGERRGAWDFGGRWEGQ